MEVSRHIEGSLDREEEDFELSVSSAGVDHPFVILRQYVNSIDKKIRVLKLDGTKINGILKSANNEIIEVLEEVKGKSKKNKKSIFGEVITIPMTDIKETKRIITF